MCSGAGSSARCCRTSSLFGIGIGIGTGTLSASPLTTSRSLIRISFLLFQLHSPHSATGNCCCVLYKSRLDSCVFPHPGQHDSPLPPLQPLAVPLTPIPARIVQVSAAAAGLPRLVSCNITSPDGRASPSPPLFALSIVQLPSFFGRSFRRHHVRDAALHGTQP